MTLPPAYGDGAGGAAAAVPFSSSELLLPGVLWTTGAQLFQKTIDTGTLPDTATKNVAHGVTGIDLIVDLYGFATTGTAHITLPYVSKAALTFQIGAEADDTNIIIITGMDRTPFTTSSVTILYTKS